MYGAGFKSLCIGSERDPKTHSRMKKSLASAFSTKALAEQEIIVQRCLDGFIEKVGRLGQGPKGIDMTEWFEMIAFDVLGEMAFGESFSSVEQGPSLPAGSVGERIDFPRSRQATRLAAAYIKAPFFHHCGGQSATISLDSSIRFVGSANAHQWCPGQADGVQQTASFKVWTPPMVTR